MHVPPDPPSCMPVPQKPAGPPRGSAGENGHWIVLCLQVYCCCYSAKLCRKMIHLYIDYNASISCTVSLVSESYLCLPLALCPLSSRAGSSLFAPRLVPGRCRRDGSKTLQGHGLGMGLRRASQEKVPFWRACRRGGGPGSWWRIGGGCRCGGDSSAGAGGSGNGCASCFSHGRRLRRACAWSQLCAFVSIVKGDGCASIGRGALLAGVAIEGVSRARRRPKPVRHRARAR